MLGLIFSVIHVLKKVEKRVNSVYIRVFGFYKIHLLVKFRKLHCFQLFLCIIKKPVRIRIISYFPVENLVNMP